MLANGRQIPGVPGLKLVVREGSYLKSDCAITIAKLDLYHLNGRRHVLGAMRIARVGVGGVGESESLHADTKPRTNRASMKFFIFSPFVFSATQSPSTILMR